MSIVRPFKAFCPRKSLAGKVACPPYDVIDRDEARKMAEGNPLSFLHVVKSEIDFPDEVSPEDGRVYLKAAENLQRMIDANVFLQHETPCFYLYRQQMGGHRQHGIVGCVPVDEYEHGTIRKHELTLKEKEADRTRHIETVNAQTGLVFLTYRADEDIDGVVRRVIENIPQYDFETVDGIRHTAWIIDGSEEILRIQEAFGRLDALYIADGHHRAAAAATVGKTRREKNPRHRGDEAYNFIMAAIFPHNQLKILDYNRVVKDLNGLSDSIFLDRIGEEFFIREPFREKSPAGSHAFGMYFRKKWRLLELREKPGEDEDIVGRLDVSILQKKLLGPVLAVGDPRTDRRILFVGGGKGLGELERLVDSEKYAVAFALHPTTVEELMAVADQGKIMPPKSTWFEPKLRSGIFIHRLDED